MKYWIPTFGGLEFNLDDPQASLVDPYDIGHALANINRFTGHTLRPYSVAEHSLLVARLAPAEHKLQALLHDATEAYVGDLNSMVKRQCPAFQELEDRVRLAVAQRFRVEPEIPQAVHTADLQALLIERDALYAVLPPRDWGIKAKKHPDHDLWVDILSVRTRHWLRDNITPNWGNQLQDEILGMMDPA